MGPVLSCSFSQVSVWLVDVRRSDRRRSVVVWADKDKVHTIAMARREKLCCVGET